jgi:hypothetical protein
LTFDGTADSTYFYNTSGLQPGDIVHIGIEITTFTTRLATS